MTALQTARSKGISTENRLNALVTLVGNLAPLLSMSSAQLTALAGLTAAQLTALGTITAAQLDLYGTINTTFIAGLSKLPNQSDSNSTLGGVETFCNNLSDNLQSNGYMFG